jgi:ATP-binding protein involved in chromosome partitioning
MFQKVNVPLLGIVENMSWFTDPAGIRHALFGEGGGQLTADSLGTSLLGQVPLIPEVRVAGDAGTPLVAQAPDGEAAQHFTNIVVELLARLEKKTPSAEPPVI